MSEPLPKIRNNHQERILSAATEIFPEKGYGETSTAEIARRSKVSKRELYSNFHDKRDILATVITELQSRIQTEANISLSSSAPFKTVLTKAGNQISDFINSKRLESSFASLRPKVFETRYPSQQFHLLGPGAERENIAAFIKRQMKAGDLRKSGFNAGCR